MPKLLGFYYPDSGLYHHLYNPSLADLFKVLYNGADNTYGFNLATWGNLDIQCLLRLFDPTEEERYQISRGISANVKQGVILGDPPIMRTVSDPKLGDIQFYVSSYISGRSLKLGYIHNGREYPIWVFNISQFYPGTIAQNAKGLHLKWRDFPRNSHIIDWPKFAYHPIYRLTALQSNEQDARIVSELCDKLQENFAAVFDCYPRILVSTGSLCDAAVSKELADSPDDYYSNAWKWLAANVWQGDPATVQKAEPLVSEAYSAGYVDQFAIGYWPQIWTADIASAYPHKIRNLPDLRYSTLDYGEGQLDADLLRIEASGRIIESAIIRGQVTIPATLKFHPITVKSFNRDNSRPTGTYYASYILEERRYCESYGATFEKEEYVIVSLSERKVAPLAKVSQRLGDYRAELLAEMKIETDEDRRRLLDGQQYMVKIVDNSLYGKTVMTTEIVENINGAPQIVGYLAGDRFNMLYGALITARTRIQLAEACMQIARNGGSPVMTMTDSIYWHGTAEQMPDDLIRTTKTAGYFEAPEKVEEFYLIKTGQYEYRVGTKWTYKMRGLNVSYDLLTGTESFYRRVIKDHCRGLKSFTHPKDIAIPLNTRRLITIGSKALASLGLIEEGITSLRPFVFSAKQVERFVTNWKRCLNDHTYLATPQLPRISDQSTFNYPLTFLKEAYQGNVATARKAHQMVKNVRNSRHDERLRWFARWGFLVTGILPPNGRYEREAWDKLETHFGLSHEDARFVRLMKGKEKGNNNGN